MVFCGKWRDDWVLNAWILHLYHNGFMIVKSMLKIKLLLSTVTLQQRTVVIV